MRFTKRQFVALYAAPFSENVPLDYNIYYFLIYHTCCNVMYCNVNVYLKLREIRLRDKMNV